ncbi:hypothetical protein FOZG_06376 [Fusarium oxysporum Fo47]|uniref:Uncharacterized protein n=1 Tax=Fusarium oxysporum Fo47 TaxID=660027 RepID=W9K980_FUSOX|nr:hypothetical protein FOZG_06376 [Fusarium oxysporum Fo47]
MSIRTIKLAEDHRYFVRIIKRPKRPKQPPAKNASVLLRMEDQA